jgi:hypothetical protein
LISFTQPFVTGKGEILFFSHRPPGFGSGSLNQVLRITDMIGIGNQEMSGTTKIIQMVQVMLGHWHRVDQNIPVFANPEDSVKINVPFFVEHGPTEKVLSVKLLQGKIEFG